MSKMFHVCNTETGQVFFYPKGYRIRYNFLIDEFDCSDGNEVILLNFGALDNLQSFRYYLGTYISIMSAFRTWSKNYGVGGAKNSRHMHGDGFDIIIPRGYTGYTFAKKMIEFFGEEIGVGIYNTWVHLDFRGHYARWGKYYKDLRR